MWTRSICETESFAVLMNKVLRTRCLASPWETLTGYHSNLLSILLCSYFTFSFHYHSWSISSLRTLLYHPFSPHGIPHPCHYSYHTSLYPYQHNVYIFHYLSLHTWDTSKNLKTMQQCKIRISIDWQVIKPSHMYWLHANACLLGLRNNLDHFKSRTNWTVIDPAKLST